LIKILIFEVQFHKELKEKFYNDVLNQIIEFTSNVIAEIIPDNDIPARTVAETMIGIFMGLTLMHTFKGDYGTDEQDEVVSNTLKILTHGIKDKKGLN